VDKLSHLILNRTSREQVREGIPIITRGEGVRVYDQEGKGYLDLTAGVTRPVLVGYGRREIAQAVHDQMCEMPYFTPMQFTNEPAVRLADILAEITPGKINQFFFVCDGSEAVESAIKLARHHHYFQGDKRRHKVIARRGAYHGATFGALNILGTALPMRHMMEPLSPGAVFVESPYCYRCPYHLEYPDCGILCATDIERIIQFEDPEQVSAFIGEPIQQGFGALSPPEGYWPIVQKICRDYGILLIVDEVICGFGRTGRWFGMEHFDLEPDIMAMAKGISSGYVPLGAIGSTDEVMDPVDIFEHLHTYSNHPVSCAAGIKNIEIIKNENLVENSREKGRYFLDELKELESHPIVGQARGRGLWNAIDFTSDKKTRAPFPSNRLSSLVRRALSKGLIIKTMGQAIELAPPLIIQKDEIDEGIKILEECIAEEESEMGPR
jgi:putrescine aminotransferase